MALTLFDLFGDTLLVARDQNLDQENHASQADPLRISLNTKESCHSICADLENTNRLDECKNSGDLDDCRASDGSDRRKGSVGNNLEEEKYNLVTKDGVVLDIVNVDDLSGPDVVIGIYFASSAVPECK